MGEVFECPQRSAGANLNVAYVGVQNYFDLTRCDVIYPPVQNAGARIKRVECDEEAGQFKAPFKAYRVILDKDGGKLESSTPTEVRLVISTWFTHRSFSWKIHTISSSLNLMPLLTAFRAWFTPGMMSRVIL